MYVSQKKVRRLAKWWWLVVIVILVIGGGLGGWLLHKPAAQPEPANTGVVPAHIAQSMHFKVYYPDPNKLPAGYRLNRDSFTTPVKNGVNYTVSYAGGKKMVFSIQAKPSDNDIQNFNSSYIPLRIDYQTPVGQAEIGAYHNQTLVSLPVTNGPWVIITAPPDINQDQLKQVLQAMRS